MGIKKHIAIFGAGFIGGYVGACMQRAGVDVTLIDPWPENVDAIRSRGMLVAGLTAPEYFEIRLNAIHLTEMQAVCGRRAIDIAFLAMKSYDTAWASCLLAEYLAPSGFVVSLQNGINEECIAKHVGWGRTLGCAIPLLAGELTAPGEIHRYVPKRPNSKVFVVGEVHGRATPRAREIVDLLSVVDNASVTTNLWGERWSKLVINAMRNGLSAATGLSGNQRDLTPHPRDVSIRLGSSAVRVGQALGYQLEDMLGMDPETLGRSGEGDRTAYAQIVDALELGARGRSDSQRPSMGQDIFKGRRTETDYVNGFVAQKGREAGIDVSLHTCINDLVHRVERGIVHPSPGLIEGL